MTSVVRVSGSPEEGSGSRSTPRRCRDRYRDVVPAAGLMLSKHLLESPSTLDLALDDARGRTRTRPHSAPESVFSTRRTTLAHSSRRRRRVSSRIDGVSTIDGDQSPSMSWNESAPCPTSAMSPAPRVVASRSDDTATRRPVKSARHWTRNRLSLMPPSTRISSSDWPVSW